jgi:hypothetical protein
MLFSLFLESVLLAGNLLIHAAENYRVASVCQEERGVFLKSKTLKSKEIIRLFTIIWSRVYRLNGSGPPPYCGFRSVAGSSVMSVRRIRCDREPRFGRLSNGFTWFSLIIADLKGSPLDSFSTPLQPSFSANHAQSNFNYKHQLLAFEVLSSFVFKRSFGELIDFFE